MQKRIDELSQRQAPQPSIPTVEPILTNDIGSLPMQGNGLVRDPYGNMVDPNNLPDNMKLETGPRGNTVRFADDYALQPGDPGYNQPGGGGYRPGMRPDPISIRPDLLPPKRDDFMSIGGLEGGGIDYGPGLDGNRQGMPIDPAAGLKPIRPDLLPPKRGDFMSIGGPGGGVPSPINENPGDYMLKDPGAGMIPTPAPGNTNNFGGVDLGGTPSSSILDDFVPFDPMGPPIQPKPVELPDTGMLDRNIRIGNYDLDRRFGEVPVNATPAPTPDPGDGTLGDLPPGFNMDRQPSVGGGGDIGRPLVLAQPAPVTPDPTIQPAPITPAAVAPTTGADPTQTQMPMGAIDPVLLQQATSETLTDPLIRSLYFGTQDSPGFYQQLQQAGANLIGSDVPLQQTAGLSPLELLARQKAVAGLGGFEPFLQQNRDLVDQAIAQSRRAEELQDPYYTQAEEIYKDTMGAYDPSMTQQFYNPYEDAVVQKTIQDVMEAGDKQDIASRAREISSGAFGGSRARLGAEERRESLGEGLAQALGNIRSQGFQSAQATGLGEFARQQAAKRTGAQGLMGIGVGRGSAASQLGSQLAGYGSQIGGIGQTQEQMRAGQRGELSGYGGIGRGIAETGLGRIFEQQVGQQYRPMQTLGQIGSMLPGYQASGTKIDSQYGMPTDPSAAGLGAAFSAYGALAPRQGQT